MAMIIGVRFREAGRVYYFDPGKIKFNKGNRVIVETARGLECGEVAQENTEIPDEQVRQPLKQVIRAASPADLRSLEGKEQREAEAFKVCEEKILKHELDMKLVNVEYTFDSSKIIFHFTADQRVDFRALVRDLAGYFHTRIELRQIGVRDEAKLLGGLGVCGRPFCCSLFMGDFHPVSIKMAKEQGLSLNPTKISGTCGRLMCCLKYEEAAYEELLKDLPKPGAFIETPEGKGMVTEVNAISKAVKVKLDRRPDAAPQVFQYDAIEGLRRKPAFRDGEAVTEPEAAPAEKPAKPDTPERRDDDEQREDPRRGKNWRERHAPHRQEPAYRQPPPQTQQPDRPQQQQKPPQPQKQQQQRPPEPQRLPERPPQADVKAVPRYGEVRRANAPQQPQGQGYHRQPWQRGAGQQQGQQKQQGQGEKREK